MLKKMIKSKHVVVVFSAILLLVLFLIPTGFEDALIYKGADRVTAEVLATDESAIYSSGLIQFGEQVCTVRILGGDFEGEEVEAVNMLQGSLSEDKIYEVGDTAMVVVSKSDGAITNVTMSDHYRLTTELVLIIIFFGAIILVAGWTGIRAILSFAVTVMMIWKVLVPSMLSGMSPVPVAMGITILLTCVIVSLVFGPDRRALSAISGAVLGIAATCLLGLIFTEALNIHGAVMSSSETLLYSGFEYLNLTDIFKATIFLGASGAIMDLAVDITSAVNEVVEKVPDISWREATRSGVNVGRNAMGTMTTTLLLAYSGGYLTLLMTFMAQGTPVTHILNYKSVSAEILHTLVGSFGLVTVAPFTALTSGFLLTRRKNAPTSGDALPDAEAAPAAPAAPEGAGE